MCVDGRFSKIQSHMYIHTSYYSKRCIADTKRWCFNPEVSSINLYCISDSNCCTPISMSNKVDIFSIWIYHYCSTCILYESIPLYIITSYVTIQYTSEHCSFSFTYSDIIWLINHCSGILTYKQLAIWLCV